MAAVSATATAVAMAAAGRGAGADERAGDQLLDGLVRGAFDAGEERDARAREGALHAGTDITADDAVDSVPHEPQGEVLMPGPLGVDDFGGDDLVLLDLVDLELGRSAKMLEDLAFGIRNGNQCVQGGILYHIRRVRRTTPTRIAASASPLRRRFVSWKNFAPSRNVITTEKRRSREPTEMGTSGMASPLK